MLMLALELFLKDKGCGKQYCLIGSNLEIETFWKRWNIRKGCVITEDEAPLYTLHWGFKKILCKACLLFNCFLVIKRILKALFFSFLDYWISLIYLTMAQIRGKDIYYKSLSSKCLVRNTLLPIIGGKVPLTLRYPLWFP